MAETGDQPRWIAGVKPSDEVLAMNGTQVLEYECRQQPVKLRELIAAYKSDGEIRGQLRYAAEVAASTTAPVIFIGMGGSLCASISRDHASAGKRKIWRSPWMQASGCTMPGMYGRMLRFPF